MPVAEDDLNFEATLAALLSLIGTPVELAIGSGAHGQDQMEVAHFSGVLTRTENRGSARIGFYMEKRDYNEHDTHFFCLGEGHNGFYLDSEGFDTARWLGGEGHTLYIQQNNCSTIGVLAAAGRGAAERQAE